MDHPLLAKIFRPTMTSFCLGAMFEIGPTAANGDENFLGWVSQAFMSYSINVTKRYTVWTKVFGLTSL